MTPLKAIIKKPLKDPKGFSVMELMVVIVIVGVLASIGVLSYLPTRIKALDSAAHSDARNIVSSVVNAIMSNADVDFDKTGTGGAVGAVESDGTTPRNPVFTLSPGVLADITGNSSQAPGGTNTIFSARIYHSGGTKNFFCFVDADEGISSGPN